MKKGTPILLVEDDDVDAENVVRALKKNKITNPLFVTWNGEEALSFLRNEPPYDNPETFPSPGIILLDLNMPVMNGIELLKILKNDDRLKRIPVIVLTTSREESDRVETFKLSVAGYIIKPVEFENFVQAISTINLYWTLSELG